MTARQSAEVADGWVWDGVIDLNYAHAAHVLGLPVGWLEEKVPAEEVPYRRYGRHVRFAPDDIREIRRMHHQPAKNAPATTAVDMVTDPDVIRAALLRAEAA